MNNLQLVVTEDGSHTIYNSDKSEHYHSTHGAVQESDHIFINYGLKEKLQRGKVINILEVGFGTGLNCLLSYNTQKHFHVENGNTEGCKLHYFAVEPFPIPSEMIDHLNYTDYLSGKGLKEAFMQMHSFTSGVKELSDSFILEKTDCLIQEYKSEIYRFDLVYFDAFSPDSDPALWTKEVFSKIYGSLHNDAILVTYCSKGIVRRTLNECGFKTERLPGPPGKREVLRAVKD